MAVGEAQSLSIPAVISSLATFRETRVVGQVRLDCTDDVPVRSGGERGSFGAQSSKVRWSYWPLDGDAYDGLGELSVLAN